MKNDAPRGGVLDKLGFVAVALAVLGPALAFLRLVPGLAGFGLYALGGLLAVVTAIIALIAAARGRGFGLGRVLALVLAVVFVITASGGAGVPRINDYTTDPKEPPAFVEAIQIPANAGRDMSYPPEFAAEAQTCCADLRPARLPAPPAEAFARAKRAAESMGNWEVTVADASSGRIEAVATTTVFGFRDDIAIRVRPDGSGSRIDMRSKSRDGKGDMGANADRIRAYVTTVESIS
jgi:uncharacterized protein (DUF1499 family)